MFNIIYMDNHATTPIAPEVLAAMLPYLTMNFGNASSTHPFGVRAKDAVEKARQQVAELLGCSEKEIVFTSGATESDNLAIKGIAYACREKGNHIITSTAEHHAILDTCHALAADGFETTYLPVDKYGRVSPDDVEAAITSETILMSFMYANNEVGTINPVTDIAAVAAKHGVLFHSDAVQGIGQLPSNMEMLGVNLASLTAHKIYGPKGIGALYIHRNTSQPHSLFYGGGQEAGVRPGTLNVAGIVGLGAACELSKTLYGDGNKSRCKFTRRTPSAVKRTFGRSSSQWTSRTATAGQSESLLCGCAEPRASGGTQTRRRVNWIGMRFRISEGITCLGGNGSSE